MNDLVQIYKHKIEFQGGLGKCDLTDIIMKVNDMPQRQLEWNKSWDIAQAKLAVPY